MAQQPFSNLNEILKMFSGQMAEGKLPPWNQTFSYPSLQEFSPSKLLNFTRLALFFQSLSVKKEKIVDRHFNWKYEIINGDKNNKIIVAKSPELYDEFVSGLVRLGGTIIYDASTHETAVFKFISFDDGAIAFYCFPSGRSQVEIVATETFYNKMVEYFSGYLDV